MMVISPESGFRQPDMIFARVLFPEPLSPTIAVALPLGAEKEAPLKACTCPKDLPYCVCGAVSYGKIINKKPIIATKEEQNENSRSKSAKLRIFERK